MRTSAWPILEQFSAPAVQIALTPLLLSRLSVADFALYVGTVALLVASPALSHGTSTALLSTLPASLHRTHGSDIASALVRSVLVRVAVTSALLAVVVAAVVVTTFPTYALFAGSSLVLLALSEIDGTLTNALKGHRRFKQCAVIEIVGRFGQLPITIAALHVQGSVTAALLASSTAVALKVVAKGLIWRRLMLDAAHRDDAAADPAHDLAAARSELSAVGLWSCVHVLSGVAFYAFDRFAAGVLVGSAALGAYAVCSQLAQLSHAIPSAAGQILVPWAAKRRALTADQRRELRGVAIVATMLACIPSIVLAVTGEFVLGVWISAEFAARNATLLLHLAVVFLFLSVNVPCFYLLVGLGKTRFAAMLTLSASSLLVLAVLLVLPADVVALADMKLIYAGIALTLIWHLFRLLQAKEEARFA